MRDDDELGFVWSTGLQEWEPIVLSKVDRTTLRFLYHKQMFGVHVAIFIDPLGRYVTYDAL